MKKTLLSAALMMVFSVTMLLGTTYAWWSETIEVNNNQISTGKLEMTATYIDPFNIVKDEDGKDIWYDFESGKSLFEVIKLEPGFDTTRDVNIKNDGTIPMVFKASSTLSGDEELNEALKLQINLGSRTLYNGSTSLFDGTNSPYIVLQPGEDITFRVKLSFPNTEFTVNDAYEGMTIKFPIVFEAKQVNQLKHEGINYLDKNLQPVPQN
jgi:predicted ribosomally synthesized peptide with SipW-like signal peptide